MDNIILIGMSGAGKSTLGVLLAKVINKKFLDTDLVLQQSYNRVLQEIILNEGIITFKTYEEKMLLELNVDHTVIATGGSVIYSEKGMRALGKTGLVIYIHVPYETIKNRLYNIRTRGIVMEIGQSLKALYDEREILYRKYADVIIEVQDEGIEETLGHILAKIY